MKKYIIKQIPPEHAELMYYFEGDTFTENAGGIEYALFPLFLDYWTMRPAINKKLWEDITSRAAEIAEEINNFRDNWNNWNSWSSYKEIMTFYGIPYNPTKCHRLKEWSETDDPTSPEAIAEYLTITTGRPWEFTSVRGYSQGDYSEIVYCEDIYTQQDAEAAGEIILGAANEYSITDLDDDGNEIDTVYGYIVADCQAWRPEDVKRLVCEWGGIDPAEAVLMTIEDSYTRTEYKYTEAC
jgi:hypothetical protein